ncbi:MAG TPA: hypothetical protein VF412_02810 [Bdellovibrio sp.]|uniref:hypothetical protein n=1 Tax=Bdellovibrio sp. TaxID=28201 RepID=UPI002EDD576B
MQLRWAVLLILLILNACSFSKKEGNSPESNSLTTKTYVSETPKTSLSVDDLFSTLSRSELLNYITNHPLSELEALNDDRGFNLLDKAAKKYDYELLEALLAKGFSPFAYNQKSSFEFLSPYQQLELEAFYSQAIKKAFVDLSLIKSRKFPFPEDVCFTLLTKVLEARAQTDDPKLEIFAMTILASSACSENLNSIDESKKNDLLSKEFIYQYNHDFADPLLLTSIVQNLKVKNLSISEIDPQIFLDRKEKCLSKDLLAMWTKVLNTILKRNKNYKYRLDNCEDVETYTDATFAGACTIDEVQTAMKNHNDSVDTYINEHFDLPSEVKCLSH